MAEPDRKFWFPAKRYGWGWGLPATWQGWVFLVIWAAAFTAGSTALVPQHRALYAAFVVAMTVTLLAVCYAKGEPPRWRWGGDDRRR